MYNVFFEFTNLNLGVIKMKKEGLYNVGDIQNILECGKRKAYEVIRSLNKEREKAGLLIVKGRIPAQDFNKKFYGANYGE